MSASVKRVSHRPLLIIITGPTASGKTALAVGLAEFLGTEIVSADSRQIYRDIPIGTAAPSADELARVRHHLVGQLGLDEYYSAVRFEEDALRILDGIWTRKSVALVCGGSMMYIDALTKGIDEMPTVSDTTRRYVLDMLDAHGFEGVLAQLRICDPDYYAQVDKANTRRVVHALEVSLQAGVPYSSLRTGAVRERPFDVVKFAIDWSREELFARINRRVDLMIDEGLEVEARRAFAKGNFNSLNTVGFKEMKMLIDGSADLEFVRARIAKNTRVYAKKQLTWLRRDSDVIWLDPANAMPTAMEVIRNAVSAR